MSENREPQNIACDEPFGLELTAERLSRIEQGIMNVEGKENFIISAFGGFDIRYSK